MPKLRYTREAQDSLTDIAVYIATNSGSRSIGEAFVARIRAKCVNLASLPGRLGRQRHELRPDLRSFALKGYVIFFRYRGDAFEVVTVLEGHRDVMSYFRDDEG